MTIEVVATINEGELWGRDQSLNTYFVEMFSD